MRVLKELLEAIILFFVCVLAIAYLNYNSLLLALAFLFITILIFLKWHTKEDVAYYLTAFIIGPIGESLTIYYGAWYYTNPTLFGLPIWAPMAWGAAVTIIRRISMIVLNFTRKD
ncbi:MAG: hypothetical protein QG603_558 [Patescibacteria group bacterium]|nr:hypothetical protein [Patescibacteria group bacterium]MDQ5970781.1 hypothetical protein [Patescibacteria group bacterium]